jgi:hypothetical protein
MLSLQNIISVPALILPFYLANAAPLPDAQAPSNDQASLQGNLFAFSAPSISNTLPLKVGSYPSLPFSSPKTNNHTANTSLPAPTDLTLKYITIGHGVQNYTCPPNNSAATPTAIGALATLYDITSLALLSPDLISQLPPLAASLPLTSSFIVPNTPLFLDNIGTFPVLGGHFFAADATPIFDLFTAGARIASKVVKKINAPAESNTRLEGTGAVQWLALEAKQGANGTVGLSQVFRVDTAGGNPPATCAGIEGVVSVPYAAAYHFYE